ncbi:MAG: fatty acid/phospholipid synthesis protein PlsX [Oscillospiraceae bacterium]|nr:fatty acid/phospholipid synthesis protein PlsX [Oscillospiraceae bacterium]
MPNYFKALVDADDEPIVICDVNHIIVYMNPTAVKRYAKRGGAKLIDKSIFDCHNAHSKEIILSVFEKFLNDPTLNKVYTYTKNWDNEDTDVYIVALRDSAGTLISYYEKHESRLHEKA